MLELVDVQILVVGVKTLRKHVKPKIESSRKCKLYRIYTTFLLENVYFLKLSGTFGYCRVFTPTQWLSFLSLFVSQFLSVILECNHPKLNYRNY